MKVYRPTRQLLADVECLLAASQPSAHHSPLDDVIDLLCRGRHYAWAGIFLAVGENTPQQSVGAGGDAPVEVALPETRSKILISIKLASRELGVLSVESDRENGFRRGRPGTARSSGRCAGSIPDRPWKVSRPQSSTGCFPDGTGGDARPPLRSGTPQAEANFAASSCIRFQAFSTCRAVVFVCPTHSRKVKRSFSRVCVR